MAEQKQKILLLGSEVTINNLPIKEVSLLSEGSLPAYGYNPGDFIELLAGKVNLEKGRLEQCLTWLASDLTDSNLTPLIRTRTYGEPKDIFQIFRKRKTKTNNHGWFMVHQILPPEGRKNEPDTLNINDSNKEVYSENQGIVVIDDGGRPPQNAAQIKELNPDSWVIAMGIGVAHWQEWASQFNDCFYLFCRLSDLETTRMEMDSSVAWETIVAMTLLALRTDEVGLWEENLSRFKCHIIVEMFPHGLLYIGPQGTFFRYRKGALPEKSSPRQKGSVPCYDTLVTSMLALDCIHSGCRKLCKDYFFDFSKRVLHNWHLLYEHGYFFNDGLELPRLDFSSAFLGGVPCTIESASNGSDIKGDPYFIELPPFSPGFDESLRLVACQLWNEEKKQALRSFFPLKIPAVLSGNHEAQGPVTTILNVLHHLKDEVSWKKGFEDLRLFQVGHLKTTDPAELDPVITLQNVMDSYVSRESFQRPLCIGIFGPPGSGKSFSVKQVARVISKKFDTDPFDFFEFNLTQFDRPEEINSAIEPIRASVARGKVPIVFWDEFDCRYEDHEFGYLRYFLPSMQDGVTFVHGTPYYIGRSIFVFAGGVKASWADMEALLSQDNPETFALFKTLKIPDFMSRLRVVLDIDGIEINDELLQVNASENQLRELHRILLKRAFIIAHQMDTHWKKAARKTSGLLLRLLIAKFKFGARSIEAVIEASSAADRLVYGLPELIAPSAARIHATWRIDLEKEVDLYRKQHGLRAVW